MEESLTNSSTIATSIQMPLTLPLRNMCGEITESEKYGTVANSSTREKKDNRKRKQSVNY